METAFVTLNTALMIWAWWLCLHLWEQKYDIWALAVFAISLIPGVNIIVGIPGFTVWFLETLKGIDDGTKHE